MVVKLSIAFVSVTSACTTVVSWTVCVSTAVKSLYTAKANAQTSSAHSAVTTGRRVRSRESPGDYIVRFMREMEEGTRLNIHKLRYGPSTINEDNIRTLEKYDNRLPRTYEQKVNHLIKEIAREAGITEKVEVSYIENGEKKSRQVEKCDLVKTHTARRSGATNMYLAGIPTIAIMKITGHKTEREFMKYIKITEEQTALELMSHPYFSGKQASE